MRTVGGSLLALALLSTAHRMAVARFDFAGVTLLPGSRLALRLSGIGAPQEVALVGEGRIENGYYEVASRAQAGTSTLVAASDDAIAVRTIHIANAPRPPVIAVAAYDDGIVFHDARTFAPLGTLATGGSPSDVAATYGGFVATDTDGDALTNVTLSPWNATSITGVPLGDEVVADPASQAIFVSERSIAARGGVARIGADGNKRLLTGTAEGIALDRRRDRLYVADVDLGDVAIVDAKSMRLLTRIRGIPRAFGLALSPNGRRLYAVSNQGRRTFLGAPGRVTEIALYPRPHIVARSIGLTFPVGVVSGRRRIFVTDEQADTVDVLDARTLRMLRPPVRTCSIPWKPHLERRAQRLYIPCAGSNEVDVFDTRTLSRVRGAPFPTGGYPLAVAVSR